MISFFCATVTCVQMFTGVTPTYSQTPDAYVSISNQRITYCKRARSQYVCMYDRNASSTAADGSVIAPGFIGD